MTFGRLENLIKFEGDGDKGGSGTDTKFSQGDLDKAVQSAVDKAVGEVNGLKEKNSQLLQKMKVADDKVTQFDGMTGDDVKEFQKFKTEKAEADKKKKLDAGKWEDLEKQLIGKHNEVVVLKDKRIAHLYKEVDKNLIDAELGKALAKKGGQPHLILHELKKNVKIFEDESTGKFNAEVIDPVTGNVKIADDKGTHMTMDQLVDIYHKKPEWAGAFSGTKHSGSGTQQGGPSGSGLGGKTMTQTEFAALDLKQMETARVLRSKGELTVIDG